MEGGPRVYRFFAKVSIYTRVCIHVLCIRMLCTYTNVTRTGNEKEVRENRNGKLSRNDIASYRRLVTGWERKDALTPERRDFRVHTY